jgi:hypothetical protein
MTFSTDLCLTRMWPVLVAHHGLLIDYVRDETAYSLTAVKGSRNIEVAGTDYTTTVIADQWFFKTEDVIASGLGECDRYDRILWEDPMGRSITCEIHLPGGGRQWNYADNEGAFIVVYAIQVSG